MLRAMDRAQKSTRSFGDQVRSRVAPALKTGAVAAAGLAVALGGQAVTSAIRFERQMAEVRTLLPQVTDDGFGRLSDGIRGVSREFGIATDDAIPALYQAISAGIPHDNALSFIQTAAKASIGGVTDLETSVDALTTVLNTWGKTAGVSAAQAADVLFTSVRLGKTTFGELGASINQVAGLASSFGIEFEEVAAGWTEVTKAGVPTAEAMTKMRALIQSVTAPTKRAAVQFEALGIETSAARVANEGLLPVLREIIAATAGNEAQQRQLFGSVEALQAALVITSGEGRGFAATLDEMRAATGATDAAFETMADTSSHRLQVAVNEFKVTLGELGEQALPLITQALAAAAAVMPHLAAAADSVSRRIDAMSDGIETAADTITGLADRAKSVWGAVTSVFRSGSESAVRSLGIVDEGAREAGRRVRAELAFTANSGITSFNNLADSARANAERIAAAMTWSAARMRSAQRAAVRDAAGYQVDLAQIDRLVAGSRWDTTREVAAATTAQLSDADRLAAGLAVAMTDACGTVTGFRQCVFGQVVEFDAGMNAILTDAQKMQFGLAVEMTNACGTVTGFRQCVDGQVVEFDAAMTRIVSDADRLAAGIAVPMVNACGTVTGFRQCVDGAVVEFDAGMNRILTDADRLAAGMAVVSRDACGAITAIRKCVDGVETDISRPGRGQYSAFGATNQNPVTETDGGEFVLETGYYDTPQGRRYTYQTSEGQQVSRIGDGPYQTYDFATGTWTDLPDLASGGIVRARRGGTLVRVGEGGRDEAVIPLGRGAAQPTISVDIRVEGSVVSEGDLGQYIVERVTQAVRAGSIDMAAAT